ncbi:MAG: alpha/beta hydrolase [Pseudomonadota bacterium]|nr:alpha/beta hydrolase [Pseudomonadota bacterium]
MPDDIKEFNAQDANLLARYRGAKPEAPAWFETAVNTPYSEHFADVDGVRIRYQRWGDRSKPSLMLCHGNGAHAHWYDFIGPAMAAEYHVIAMTFSGMGDSDWRDSYDMDKFSAEQIAVCEHAGLFDDGRKPVIVAHSFGGFITMNMASRHSQKFAGVIIVDSPIRPPEDEWDGPPVRSTRNRVYANLEAGLARFRLAPPQPCENHYIVDYIGRHSLKQVENTAGQSGWTWKFDPGVFVKFDFDRTRSNLIDNITCKLSFMRGEDSVLVSDRIWDYMRGLRDDLETVSIPGAQHHVMLDQPLAFVQAVKDQLRAWAY